MKNKDYEAEMERLQGELVAMQEWVKATGAKVCIVFEGRDTAGKGGTIKRITERVSPRVFRVVALPAPTEREKSQMYIQRYIAALPGGRRGRDLRPQLVQPRRRRAGDGLLHPGADRREFLEQVPGRREGDGRLRDHPDQVLARGQPRRADPAARGPDRRPAQDLEAVADWTCKSYSRWYDYSRARDAMFAATDTDWAPWFVADTDDKKRGRLNIITHLLDQIPYEPLEHRDIKLPDGSAPAATSSPTCRRSTSRRPSERAFIGDSGPKEPQSGGSPGSVDDGSSSSASRRVSQSVMASRSSPYPG